MGFNNEHLTLEILEAFNNNQLEYEEHLKVLEHISSCDECADLYSTSLIQKDMISAPHYLKSTVISRVQKKNPFIELFHTKKASMNRQLFIYSLKVSIAMCGALLFLYSGLLNQDFDRQNEKIPIVKMDTLDKVNNKLYEFSNKLVKTEENYYDKEKK